MEVKLKCNLCGREFDKAATHKRHGYYCRSRSASAAASRKRSCIGCSRAKTRCDCFRPQCSRCVARGVECQYRSDSAPLPSIRVGSESLQHEGDGEPVELALIDGLSDDLPSLDTPERSTLAGFGSTGSTSAGDIDAGVSPPPSLSATFDVTDADILGLSLFPVKDTSSLLPFLSYEAMQIETTPQVWSLDTASTTPLPNVSAEMSPQSPSPISYRDPDTCLTKRKVSNPRLQINATLLKQIICSFPTMMLRRETFPPMIHRRCFSDRDVEDGENNISETLANCMSLAGMFASRTAVTSKLLWRTVKMEQERLLSEYHNFSDWELLAAIQALVIYSIMQVMDAQALRDHGFKMPLLYTLEIIGSALQSSVGQIEAESEPNANKHTASEWPRWIFLESCRRFVILTKIIATVFEMDQYFGCHYSSGSGFMFVPLHARKTLWEAPSAKEWRIELEAVSGCPCTSRLGELFGVTDRGDLVRLRQRDGRLVSSPAVWEEWLATRGDELGMAVMIVASMVNLQ